MPALWSQLDLDSRYFINRLSSAALQSITYLRGVDVQIEIDQLVQRGKRHIYKTNITKITKFSVEVRLNAQCEARDLPATICGPQIVRDSEELLHSKICPQTQFYAFKIAFFLHCHWQYFEHQRFSVRIICEILSYLERIAEILGNLISIYLFIYFRMI